MFKKLLTLCAAAALAYNVQAQTVEAYYCDYANETSWSGWVMGYIPQVIDGELVAKAPMIEYVEVNDENAEKYADDGWDSWENITINGNDNKIRPLDEPAGWYQFFLSKGQVPGKKGMMHFITVNCYAPELEDGATADVTLQCRWSWGEDPINVVLPVTNKKEDVTVVCNGPAADNFDIIYQTSYQGEVHICTLKVTYENIVIEKQYDDILTNGDASADWENPYLTINDAGWENICVWGKEDKSDPHPATIETVDGDRVFVVHATAMTENPWDNQMWICSPRTFDTGEEFNVNFRLKATAEAAPGTQTHKAPSDYMHWACIGNPSFKTDWSVFDKDVTVDSNMGGMSSIAFNLNDYEAANDYYMDDVKWRIAKILDGWFIASDAIANGILDAAVEMTEGVIEVDGDEFDAIVAVVGNAANPASWVKISEKKGSDAAFNSACIGIEDEVEKGEVDTFHDYQTKKNAKIELPEAGTWKVAILPDFQMVLFQNVSGTDGINTINANNAAPVYYNLQGVRVDNPTNGIYIVKAGNKVSKKVIR